MGRDPDYLAHMRAVAQASAAPSGRTIADLRRRHAEELASTPRPPVGHVADLTIDAPAGPLPARIYHPVQRPAPTGTPAPRPPTTPAALVFAHGGGWALGDVDTYDPVARVLTDACRAAVLSVDYRRPPEHPFPAPLDDLVAALRWARRNAGRLGLDATRIGVAGDSAGANLAAAATLRLRDEGDPPPALQLLVYPAVDLRAIPPLPTDPDGLTFSDPSGRGMARIRDLYLAGADPEDPLASPLLVPDPAGLPPTVIATAEYDRLRPQGHAYAQRLAAAGVDTTYLDGAGLDHGYLGHVAFARRPADTVRAIGLKVQELLRPR